MNDNNGNIKMQEHIEEEEEEHKAGAKHQIHNQYSNVSGREDDYYQKLIEQ